MDEVFLGRETQRKQIARFLKDSSQTAAIVYGRRRIGKTGLIKHCLSEFSATSIYYECKETSEENNVKSLAEIVGERLGFPPRNSVC